MCGVELTLWEETVSFLCWGHLGQPHVALSFNILHFKYGVLESGLFSEYQCMISQVISVCTVPLSG